MVWPGVSIATRVQPSPGERVALPHRPVRLVVAIGGGIEVADLAGAERARRTVRRAADDPRPGARPQQTRARRMVAMGVGDDDRCHGFRAEIGQQGIDMSRIVRSRIDHRDASMTDDVGAGAAGGEGAAVRRDPAAHERGQGFHLARCGKRPSRSPARRRLHPSPSSRSPSRRRPGLRDRADPGNRWQPRPDGSSAERGRRHDADLRAVAHRALGNAEAVSDRGDLNEVGSVGRAQGRGGSCATQHRAGSLRPWPRSAGSDPASGAPPGSRPGPPRRSAPASPRRRCRGWRPRRPCGRCDRDRSAGARRRPRLGRSSSPPASGGRCWPMRMRGRGDPAG